MSMDKNYKFCLWLMIKCMPCDFVVARLPRVRYLCLSHLALPVRPLVTFHTLCSTTTGRF